MKDKVQKAMANNREIFMERGPGLYSDWQTWVVARDRKKGLVLVGGLGCMGCGEMWMKDDGKRSDRPGYADAPEAEGSLTLFDGRILK